MIQPHDSQVGWQLLKRNLDKLSTITADKGYDWWLLRTKLRAEGVKPPHSSQRIWLGRGRRKRLDGCYDVPSALERRGDILRTSTTLRWNASRANLVRTVS
jgi:hypothetical protein